MRVCIAGGPKVGKTTLAESLRLTLPPRWVIYNADAFCLGRPWSQQSTIVLPLFDIEGPWVIEGVPVIRALRKWLQAHPEGKPCDTLYWRFEARAERSRGQESLAKGCLKVYDEIRDDLLRRGVDLKTF